MRFTLKPLKRVKQELNGLYSVPPFDTDSGLDFGWFCREHALHLYLLSCVLGARPEIVIGDICISYRDELVSTFGDSGEHVWCSVDDICPVDLSVTLRFIDGFPDLTVVYGENSLKDTPYHLIYHNEPLLEHPEIDSERPAVVYAEHVRFELDPVDLLEVPYCFLREPPPGRQRLTDTVGVDIFSKITYHCLQLYKSEVTSGGVFPMRRTLREVAGLYNDPTARLRTMIRPWLNG